MVSVLIVHTRVRINFLLYILFQRFAGKLWPRLVGVTQTSYYAKSFYSNSYKSKLSIMETSGMVIYASKCRYGESR